jgi:hypothetical protein
MRLKNFRDLSKMNYPNDGTRTLMESIIVPEISSALNDLKYNKLKNYCIIGGLALSYYVKPRMTIDIDILFLDILDIPNELINFKKHRKSAFQHNVTHVEVETLSPGFIDIPNDIAKKIIETSTIVDNFNIASPSGLVVSKLFRFSRQDQADIENLIIECDVDISDYNLTDKEIEKYERIIKELPKNESNR